MKLVQGTSHVFENMKNAIVRDIQGVHSLEGSDSLPVVLNAYNAYQEEERDGVDYIFDIRNIEDLTCCVNGGMTAKEIHDIYEGSKNHTPYFYFGVNHKSPEPIKSIEVLRDNLANWLDEVLPPVIAFPFARDAYKELYVRYVTTAMLKD
ncbi:MAG: hypothetical protein J6Y37_18525 [Paludibacteraceae bacterium]|nr:hypothetical protein [Paludibacteraceae bacterium]